jgi:anti-anti-sigma regulatory factor
MPLFGSRAVTIRFEGSMDVSRKAEIRNAFESIGPGDSVLVDLSEAGRVDATFAVELLKFSRDRDRHVPLTIVTAPGVNGHILALLGGDTTANVVEVIA